MMIDMNTNKQFQQAVRGFCILQVALLSLMIVLSAVLQIVLLPEVGLHPKALCLLAAFFFLAGVIKFFLCTKAIGQGQSISQWIMYYPLLRFSVCIALTAGYFFNPSGTGWVFVVQMVVFYVAQLLFECWFYRRQEKAAKM